MRDVVRIGAGSAFAVDTGLAVPQMLRSNPPDYLVFEHLAEGGLTLLFQAAQQNPDAGYSRHFIDVHVGPYLAQLVAAKVKIITNAGALNPRAAARALHKIAAEQGVSVKIAVVEGDNLYTRIDEFEAK